MQRVLQSLKLEFPTMPIVLEHSHCLLVFDKNLESIKDALAYHLVDIVEVIKNETHFKLMLDYNACLFCNALLGSCNPRQLCGKYFCKNEK